LIGLGAAISWRSASESPAAVTPAVADAVQLFVEPFAESTSDISPTADGPQPASIPWPLILTVVWASGCLSVIAARIHAWRSVRAAVSASAPAVLCGVECGIAIRATPGLVEPGRARILMPHSTPHKTA